MALQTATNQKTQFNLIIEGAIPLDTRMKGAERPHILVLYISPHFFVGGGYKLCRFTKFHLLGIPIEINGENVSQFHIILVIFL